MATIYKPITYNYTGSFQTFTVPRGVTKIYVDMVGCQGMTSTGTGSNNRSKPGQGGRVECEMKVKEGETYYIWVGGWNGVSSDISVYNASDIRTNNNGVTDAASLSSRLIVAGAGGAASNSTSSAWTDMVGGLGGGLVGGNGTGRSYWAYGGTQTAGGAAGAGNEAKGTTGQFGLGGNGAQWSNKRAGCGGAGWYGGGGGSLDAHDSTQAECGVGGGGSSYTDATKCSNVVHTQGYYNNSTEAYVTISFNK